MIVTLTGPNSFALRQRLNELVDNFVSEYGELAVVRADGHESEAEGIIEAIQSPSFLSPHKMVVVREGSTNKSFSEQIEQIISSITEGIDVIFYEPVTDRRTAYYKTLKSKTQLEEFSELDERTLAKWLSDEAKKSGGELSLADADYLVRRLGANQQLLYNELQKLLVYNNKVVRENIDLLTDPTPQSKVFDLLDAAFAGRKEKALNLYDDQRSQNVEPQAILAMIAWQLQLFTLIKFSKGQSTTQIAKAAGMNPYPVNKAAGLANNLSDDKLRDMVDEALDIDIKSKTTALDLDEALKTYIVTL